MLLAGRQGEDEAALALGVDGLAGKPPGHLADEFLAGREQADIGPAELQADADRLALADDDVGAHLARRLDQAERDRLGHHRDQQRALGMGRVGDRLEVGDPAEDVGILDHHRAGLVVDRGDQRVGVGRRFERRVRRSPACRR